MGEYRKITDAPAVESFPRINAKKYEKEINKLFKPYLFFHSEKDGRTFECSYCMKKFHRGYIQRTMKQNDMWLMDAQHNDEADCPYCGCRATMKNVSRLGKKKNLEEYQPVCIISEKKNELYIRAYWARKDYLGALTAPPTFYCVELYHFAPNRADMYANQYGIMASWSSIADNYDPNHRKITEPFTQGGWMNIHYVPYHVFGWEEIEKSSFFRYSQYDRFSGRDHSAEHYSLMKYLAAYCIYPKNIEQLMKCGFRQYVDDLVDGRRKNAKAIKWGEDDPRKSFGLNGQELKEYISRGNDKPELLVIYKRLRRAGMPVSFDYAEDILRLMSYATDEFISVCVKENIAPIRLINYLNKHKSKRSIVETFKIYKDYLDMANKLGWDLSNDTVKLPKALYARHDEATAEINAKAEMIAAAERAERRAEAEKHLAPRRLKYNFNLDGYFIRIAETEEEILAEGKALHHCVGGYAQRHICNKTTILFLRKESLPDTPRITIEMDGERLVQIHGFRNDAGSKNPPRTEYAFIVDPWLEWIKAGSKRDKNGKPKIKTKKEIAA